MPIPSSRSSTEFEQRPQASQRLRVLRCALGVVACALVAAASPAELPLLPEVLAGAYSEGAFDGDEPRVEARLLVHPEDLAAGAERIRLGVLLTPDPGWHIYWSNPGDSGIPTRVTWQLEGGDVAGLAWPAPKVFEEADGFLRTHGYGTSVMLTAEASLGGNGSLVNGARWLRAEVDLLACEIGCIPGKLSLSQRLVAGSPGPADTAVAVWFRHAERQLPAVPKVLGVSLEALDVKLDPQEPQAWLADIAVRSCRGADTDCRRFAPVSDPTAFVPAAATAVTVDMLSAAPEVGEPDGFVVRLTGQREEGGLPSKLTGVLALRDSAGRVEHISVDVPLTGSASIESVTGSATGNAIGLLQALAFALLGGLLLNLMPCVLPVLAIKLCGVAELAQHDRRELRRHAFAYTLGILATLWALATVVVALRGAGSMVGWGFQFQEPIFLLAVSTILVVFALNLFGVFEIEFNPGALAEVGRQATGARRSFFEGLLAVVLATPCSAPFLGTAVGLAFAGSAGLIYGVFGAIGLGLALPYLAVCHVPAWQRWVPRSGAWMLRVRAGLGFTLLGSVVWILWIAGRSIGMDAIIAILAFLLCVAFAAWIFGWVQSVHRPRWTRAFATGLVLVAIAGPMWIRLEPAGAGTQSLDDTFGEAFSRTALETHLAEGRAAFVYFTADWCLTCKVNERLVLNDPEVRSALAAREIVVLRADWTQRDDAIRAELESLGKAAVPVYAVYDPREPQRPNVLPELLTRDLLVGAVTAASNARVERAAAPKL